MQHFEHLPIRGMKNNAIPPEAPRVSKEKNVNISNADPLEFLNEPITKSAPTKL
jgi:hypothetical protein